MNTLDAIFTRKSVRNFCGAPSAEELNTVLKALTPHPWAALCMTPSI